MELRRRTASASSDQDSPFRPAPGHGAGSASPSARDHLGSSDGGGSKQPAVHSSDPWMTMTCGKGTSRFIRRLRMRHFLGMKLTGRMWPARQMRGRDRRRRTWWNRKLNCIAIEGQDFAQDTQEGGADEFELIPDSYEEGAKGSTVLADDHEYVPETEPQDAVMLSTTCRPSANQGRKSLSTMLHEWRRAISDMENESGKVQMDNVKLEKHSAKVEMDSAKLKNESGKVQMDSVKLEKESAKVEMDNAKLEKENAKVRLDSVKLEKESVKVEMDTSKEELDHKASFSDLETDDETCKEELDHKASFSDLETDDETCWFQDGVDLRGHSQLEDDDVNEQGLLIVFVIRVGQLLFVKLDANSICVHAKVVYDIVEGYLVLPVGVGHLNQMHDLHCHLV